MIAPNLTIGEEWYLVQRRGPRCGGSSIHQTANQTQTNASSGAFFILWALNRRAPKVISHRDFLIPLTVTKVLMFLLYYVHGKKLLLEVGYIS